MRRDGSPEPAFPPIASISPSPSAKKSATSSATPALGRYVFFQAPIPPEIIDPEKIKKLKAEGFGLVLVRDLLRFGVRTLLGVWPDLIAADDAEAMAHMKIDELVERLKRAGGTTETSVVYEP